MTDSELISLLRLQALPNIGDISAKKLLRKFETAENLFKTKKSDLLKIEGFGTEKLKEFFNERYLKAAEEELELIRKNDIQVRYFKDKTYPELLKHCIDSPILLFQKGNISLKNRPILSIVGTRKDTDHGKAFVNKLIEGLAPLNPIIVSGFAFGIDISAHKAALKNNLQTIGCMAQGLTKIYPKDHYKYKATVEANGGLVTNFWNQAELDRKNFLSRNRIIAGMSEATLVVESGERGGSLVTADIAFSYDRPVFAVPGRPTDRMSKGCNTLIKTNKAQAITCAEDIIYLLNWDIEKEKSKPQTQLFVDLSPEEEKIIEALRKLGKAELDDLALESKMPGYKVASYLLNLELNNLIRPLPGNQYEAL